MSNNYNILVIDDDAFMRDACHQALAKQGHSTTLATSGREGLALLEKSLFDLVLLDLNLPNEDGLFILAMGSTVNRNIHISVFISCGQNSRSFCALKVLT